MVRPVKYQKRLAARLLKCGVSRVWLDPTRVGEVEDSIDDSITRQDIRGQIRRGGIQRRQKLGVSRSRANLRRAQRKGGRRRGQGSRKGGRGARGPKKSRWIHTIRPIRERLRTLRESKAIDRSLYRRYYRMAKGGVFKSKAHLELQMRMAGVLKGK